MAIVYKSILLISFKLTCIFRKRRQRTEHGSPLPLPPATEVIGTYIAETHDDTTEGATHLFQDEDGE